MKHDTAAWAAGAAFFGNLIGLKIVGNYTPLKVLTAVGISVCVAATVYCKERLEEAKEEKEKQKNQPPSGGSP